VLDLLKKEGAPTAQAESVAEAVIRHQDLGETGFVTSITAVVLLATIFGEFGYFSYNLSWWGRGWRGWMAGNRFALVGEGSEQRLTTQQTT
jgi:hypothetical protein